MQFLIAMLDLSFLVDPHKRVLNFLSILAGLMNADLDWKFIFARRRLKTSNKRAFVCRLNNGEAFGGVGSYVIGRLWQKESLEDKLANELRLVRTLH